MQLWFRVIFVSLWRFQAKVRNTDFLGSGSVKRHELNVYGSNWAILKIFIYYFVFFFFFFVVVYFIVFFQFGFARLLWYLFFLDVCIIELIYFTFCWWNFYFNFIYPPTKIGMFFFMSDKLVFLCQSRILQRNAMRELITYERRRRYK